MAKTIKLNHTQLSELLSNLLDVQAGRPNAGTALQESIESVEAWAEFTEEPERVIFRKFPHNGDIIALLPDQINPRTGMIGSYMHVGQHSDTLPDFGDTKPADEHEYAPLLGELKRQGYANLKVVKRLTIKR